MFRALDREVLPSILCPADPCAGDEVLYDPGSHENALRVGLTLDRPSHEEADLAFFLRYLDAISGRCPFSDASLAALATLLGIDGPVRHDTRPPRVAEVEVEDEILADVVEDFVPDFRLLVERITGTPDHAPISAVAALLFLGIGIEGRRPLELWDDEKTERPLLRSAKVIDSAPPCLYRDGRPLLPLSPRWTPPSGPPGVYVARAYPLADRWAWSGRVDLPATPDSAVLLRRLTLELYRFRRHERRSSFEDLLRHRSEVVYRASAEGAARAAATNRVPG